MIPREQQAETLVKPKSKEFNPSTVIDIPNVAAAVGAKTGSTSSSEGVTIPATATSRAIVQASATTADRRKANNVDAAVVLSVCSNLAGTCTHPAHLYIETPSPLTLPLPPLPPTAPSSLLSLPILGVYSYSGGTVGLGCMADVDMCGGGVGGGGAAAALAVNEKKYMADYQRCCPPPMFIILISLLEIGVFVYDYMTVEPQSELNSTSIPSESVLIYRPDRRLEIWRFISYMVLHANWFHLGFNVVIQLLYGLPLEMVHGSMRIAVIYLAGVFAGSLGTSVVDSEVYLVGASGGVYALLAAQLANILLNFGQMRYGISQLVSVVIFVSCDLGYAFYSKYLSEESKTIPSVSYIAHLTGSLAGFTMGLLILRNFENHSQQKTQSSNLIWWLALGVYSAFTIFAIVFNLINTVTAQMLEEEGEVMKQHLLHDLGIS